MLAAFAPVLIASSLSMAAKPSHDASLDGRAARPYTVSMAFPVEPQATPRLPWIDRLARKGIKAWTVPGAAVGVVAGDGILHAAGYGLRDIRRRLPVTERTLFTAGSCTKSFTAAAVIAIPVTVRSRS
jgi:CubicO group peptidase (beta-lactamase class C family)